MVQNEFIQLAKGFQLSFPLSNDSLFNLLLRIRRRASRKQTAGGYYQNIIEDLCATFNKTEKEIVNPRTTTHIIMADDNIFCNSTLKTIIEKLGKYQVHAFFNGVEVFFAFITNKGM